MPPKRSFQKRGRSGRGRGRFGPSRSPFSAQQLTVRASGREQFCTVGPTNVAGAVSGGALGFSDVLATNIGAFSGVLGYYLPLKPASIGRRVRDLANCGYAQYRVLKLTLRYRPVNNFVNVAATSASYPAANSGIYALQPPNTNFAIGWVADPAVGSLLYPEVIQAGGRVVNALRPFTMNIRPNRAWRYVLFSDVYTNTTSELRQEFIGQLNTAWESPAALNTDDDSLLTWGTIEADWVVEFRFPLDPSSDDSVRGSSAGVTMVHDVSLAHEGKHHQSQGPNGLAKELGAAMTGAASVESEDSTECKSISSTIHISHFDPSIHQKLPAKKPVKRLALPAPSKQ